MIYTFLCSFILKNLVILGIIGFHSVLSKHI